MSEGPVTLAELITHFHRKSVGMRPLIPEQRGDYIAAFAADPDLVTEARAELARLQKLADKWGSQFEKRDHEGHIRLRAVKRMLSRYDAA